MNTGKYPQFDAFVLKRAQQKSAQDAGCADLQPQRSGRNRQRRRPQERSRQEQSRDQQIWLLHQKMVDKLLQQPELLPPLIARLEQEQQQGALRHSEYLFWSCAFAAYADAALFRASLLDPGIAACTYRRRTRLRGILSEAERRAVLTGEPA